MNHETPFWEAQPVTQTVSASQVATETTTTAATGPTAPSNTVPLISVTPLCDPGRMHDQMDHRSGATRPPLFGLPTIAGAEITSPLRSTLNSISWLSSKVRNLADQVGGIDALEDLDAVPIPDEPFSWMGVRESHKALVGEVVAAVDAAFDTAFEAASASPLDVEYRTITRRLLARVADRDPTTLVGSAAARIAAALAWIALSGNEELRKGSAFSTQALWGLLGVTNSGERGRTLQRALDFMTADEERGWSYRARTDVVLNDTRFLHSRHRAALVRQRDELVTAILQERALGAARHSVVLQDDYRHIAARPITPRSAQRAAVDGQRPVIAVTLGEHRHENEVVALTIHDAQRLVVMLEQALVSQYSRPHPDDLDDLDLRW